MRVMSGTLGGICVGFDRRRLLASIVVVFLFLGRVGLAGQESEGEDTTLAREVIEFVRAKERHARALAKDLQPEVSTEVWQVFREARSGTTATITNAVERLRRKSGEYDGEHDYSIVNAAWPTVLELSLAAEAFSKINRPYSLDFGRQVLATLPKGAVYFGGTDAGRGVITTLSRSHQNGDPVMTLTQNHLVDPTYLEYVRATYGDRIRLPDEGVLQRIFEAYLKDVVKRREHDLLHPEEPQQVKEGEELLEMPDGQVSVGGRTAVMAINGLIAKHIIDSNPGVEFFLEESYPIDWMYPHLAPHGYILKLHRKPLPEFSQELMARDRELWRGLVVRLLGERMASELSVPELCARVSEHYRGGAGFPFAGDSAYLKSNYSQLMYGSLRGAIGGLYRWRSQQDSDIAGRVRMQAAYRTAFRQAFALCPMKPRVVRGFVELLTDEGKSAEALLVANTALSLNPKSPELIAMATRLAEPAEGSRRD